MVVVDSARLRLREIVDDDAAFIMELLNEPAWLRFIGDRNVRSLAAARGYIAKVRAGYATHGFGLWAVERPGSAGPIGMCGLLRRDTLEHVDIGFALLSRHWGHGYARESVEAVLTLARERFGLSRVVAITDPDNVASQRVLEKVGFAFERTIPMGDPVENLSLYSRDLETRAG